MCSYKPDAHLTRHHKLETPAPNAFNRRETARQGDR